MSDAGAVPEFIWRTTNDVDTAHALHLASLSTEPPLKVRSDGRAHFEGHRGEGSAPKSAAGVDQRCRGSADLLIH